MKRAQKWALACGLALAAVVVCYFFVDRPLALLIHAELSAYRRYLMLPTLIPEPFLVFAALLVIAAGIRKLTGRPLSRPYAVGLLWSIALVATVGAKNFFKFAFGRSWPETWIHDNPSLIRDGVYGFDPFHGGKAFAAFPSGHMAAICVAMTVLWISFPRLRALYAFAIAAVALGLILANYHFLSDVIAGGLLGAGIGAVAVALWEEWGLPRVRSERKQ